MSASSHSLAHSSAAGPSRAANGYDAAPSHLRQEAKRAIRDMLQCGVQYDDLICEGFDPVIMRQLFLEMGISTTGGGNTSDLPKDQQNNQPSTDPPRLNSPHQSKPQRGDPDKDAQILRERLLERERQEREKKEHAEQERKERQDKERKEAEARAAELVRQREAATQEEERKRREVEVKAKRELAQKKIASMVNHQKPASPGIPPTPISSTPVNAAIVSHPRLVETNPSLSQKIPGLLMGQPEVAPPAPASQKSDAAMRYAPPTVPVQPGAGTAAISSEPPEIIQPPALGARRKRPIAADLYSEPNPIRRKFGAQRSGSVIIEVSEDEEEENEVGQRPLQEAREGRQSGTGSPLGSLSVLPSGLHNGPNTGSRRIVAAPPGNMQAEALRKKEAEIEEMKAKIMAAQKKKLSKSALPTPVGTPSVGVGPTVPPSSQSQNGMAKNGVIDPSLPTAVAQGKHALPAASMPNGSEEKPQKAIEMEKLWFEDEERKKQEDEFRLQNLLEEKHRAALVDAEKIRKREQEDKALRQREEEHSHKRRALMDLENEREKKRQTRQELIAENERIQRRLAEVQKEEQAIEERHIFLAKDLEMFDQSSSTVAVVADAIMHDFEMRKNEILAPGNDNLGWYMFQCSRTACGVDG